MRIRSTRSRVRSVKRTLRRLFSSSSSELLESRILLSGITSSALTQIANRAENSIVSVDSDSAATQTHTATIAFSQAVYVAGDTLSVTITDPDLIEETSVPTTVSFNGDRESVRLFAAGNGVFTGTVATVASETAGTRWDGIISVADSGPLYASYTDPVNASGVKQSMLAYSSIEFTAPPPPPPQSGGTSGTIVLDQSQYNVGDTIGMTVEDADLAGLSQIQVSVISGSDTETVILNATSSGVFQGSIGTSAANGTSQDGTLSALGGGSLAASYADVEDATGNPATATASANISSHTATISFAESVYEAGDTLSVTITDIDLTGLSSVKTTVTFNGDRESVELFALGGGVFTGTVATTIATTETRWDGVISVVDSGRLYASYTDPVNADGVKRSLLAYSAIEFAAPPPPVTGVTGTIALNQSQYNVGNTVSITVNDADLASQSQIQVSVTSGSDTEAITLNATSVGVFQGSIGTSAASGGNQNGTLNVIAGNSITATYADALDVNGNSATASVSALLVSHTATISFGQASYEVGNTLSVTVSDVDLTGLSSISATVSLGSDQESVTLFSIGNGTFTGTIGSTGSAGGTNNGILNVTTSGTAYASYNDPVNSVGLAQLRQATSTVNLAAPPPVSEYQIVVRFTDSSLSPSQQAIFSEAAARWSEIIIGDLPDVNTSIGRVDDVVIDATAPYIDGSGGILGSAGPREVRSGSYLPAYGVMRFDSADVNRMEELGTLLSVILHEMGHVIGIGTIWSYKGLLSGGGTSDPVFTGSNARAAYGDLLGTGPTNVPVENTGGSGTRDSHWREVTFANELMTGFLSGSTNPISSVTVASLADLGYVVNPAAADPYTLPGTSLTSGSSTSDSGTSLIELGFFEDEEEHSLDDGHEHLDEPELIVLPRSAEVASPLSTVSSLSKVSSLNHAQDADWFDEFFAG